MSFGYLPWQIYVLIAFIVGIGLIVYVRKLWVVYSKTYLTGIMLIGVGSLLSGLYKMFYQFNVDETLKRILLLLAMICGLPGIILTMIGCYNNAKHSPQKKKAILILFSISIIMILLCGFVVILAYIAK